ncbi:MAG: hypothetical protein IPN79_11030 [Saprospiraceae bacterium]|nr:hypothetical protein [Saprospiraceae bacterium]
MTKLNLIYVIGLLVFTATSCKNNSNHNHDQTHSGAADHQAVIELNDGAKWSVNAEMKPFILESESILNTYVANASTDYKTLAKELTDKNSGLIESCTMDGKSHDELHKWLHPHMALIESLQDADNADAADKIINELKSSFELYNQHFQ